MWNRREGPGNQDAIFLLVKVEKLLRDLELSPLPQQNERNQIGRHVYV